MFLVMVDPSITIRALGDLLPLSSRRYSKIHRMLSMLSWRSFMWLQFVQHVIRHMVLHLQFLFLPRTSHVQRPPCALFMLRWERTRTCPCKCSGMRAFQASSQIRSPVPCHLSSNLAQFLAVPPCSNLPTCWFHCVSSRFRGFFSSSD